VTTAYKALNANYLRYTDERRRLLDRRNLGQHFARSTRP